MSPSAAQNPDSRGRHIVGVLDASTFPFKERYAVSDDNVVKRIQPGAFDDQLTEILGSALPACASVCAVASPISVLPVSPNEASA
jgi:hypothetical protein